MTDMRERAGSATILAPFAGIAEGAVLPATGIYDGIDEGLLADFAATGGWHLVLDRDAEASARYEGGVLEVRVGAGGGRWYGVQVCCLPIDLPQGYWTVEFEARSARPRRMVFDIAHVGDGWFAYAGRPVYRLGPAWTAYRLSFLQDWRHEPMARFEFNLGAEDVSADFRGLRIFKEP